MLVSNWLKWIYLSMIYHNCFGLGYPSILIPQLIASNNTDIHMDNDRWPIIDQLMIIIWNAIDSKGWVVSLDYGTTAIIALLSGQLQVNLKF